jgi:hypothetical protein
MGNYHKLTGTTEEIFDLGGPKGVRLKKGTANSKNLIEAKLTDDSDFGKLRSKEVSGTTNNNDVTTLQDLKGRVADISIAFAGASAPVVTNGSFAFCHTSGSTYTAGSIYYGKSSAWILVPTDVANVLITRSAVSGTVTLEANSIYQLEGSNWIKKGSQNDRGVRVVRLNFAYNDTFPKIASTQIQNGDLILNSIVDITTAFIGGTSMKLDINGSTPLNLMDEANSDLYKDVINQYEVSKVYQVGTTNVGVPRVTLTGTATAGVGIAYVFFITPES